MRGRTFFPIAAVVAATLAAVSLPDELPGLNVFVTGAVFVAAVVSSVYASLTRGDWVLIGLGCALGSLVLVRASEWVLVLSLMLALLALAVAVGRAHGWLEIFAVPFRSARPFKGIAFVAGPPLRRLPSDRWGALGPILRTATISIALLVVFGGLFLRADRAFASLAERYLMPDWDVSLLPARVIVAVGTLALIGAVARLSPAVTDPPTAVAQLDAHISAFEFRPTDWKAVLIAIDALFAAFVVVQITVLFGGHDHVLETAGLTYAEYARHGFFELIAVALLTLVVVAGVAGLGRAEGRDKRWMQVLLGLLCVLTLVILASALKRMNLYQDAFGFTRLRLFVDAVIFFLGGTFVLILAAGARWEGKWLPRAVVGLAVVTMIGFSLFNPDARIAEHNIERYRETGEIDLAYLSTLSADAVPEVMALPEAARTCVLGVMYSRAIGSDSLWSWNLARQRAEKLAPSDSFPPNPDYSCLYTSTPGADVYYD